MEGKTILDKGVCWRVGNGRDINIWNDNWIPTLTNKRLMVQNIMPADAFVHELIDEELRCWKLDLVSQRLPIPTKLQHFAWPLLSNTLPCFENLRNRGMKAANGPVPYDFFLHLDYGVMDSRWMTL
ncbi:conserved hypothetical protein [Ricinus communis]|uniref:Reverse transcriptase zinc-binding domain-containing protein n=1 Tax=Ricinus communis TaxID=3988 RepID=B9T2L6_RICCO|nr:conserved hypothetical protein [Ricinus communis]